MPVNDSDVRVKAGRQTPRAAETAPAVTGAWRVTVWWEQTARFRVADQALRIVLKEPAGVD